MSLDLQSLIDKLNPICRRALETAAELCVSQTNYNVEIEHLLLKLLDNPNTDIQKLLRAYDIRTEDITRELVRSIDGFKRGNSRTPALSPQIIQLLEQAWLASSLHFSSAMIRSSTLVTGLLDDDSLRGVILESSPTLANIPRQSLKRDVKEVIRLEKEEGVGLVSPVASQKTVAVDQETPVQSSTPALDQYTIDLTERARRGLIDPIQGRDAEIRQIIDILTRRRQNNPILTGEAGVGKTAVVEGFAIQIIKEEVPPSLKNISLRLLDLGLLQAGAGIKGEFEKRLKSVIDEVKGAPVPVILFVDEAHTMIGAGGPAGMGDAANLLKPALARGELRTIAATTWSEYKKYFEKDPALARRFQVVKINEPNEEIAVEMLRSVATNLEKHHNVTVLDEALKDAVRLSHRYITGRQLPDKAISVLDTACARVSIAQNATPPEIEDITSRTEQMELEISILKREVVSGIDHEERLEILEIELGEIKQKRKILEERWEKESNRVKDMLELQKKLEELSSDDADENEVKRMNADLGKLKIELANIQGNHPMVPTCVDWRVVASVISNWTGIPAGKMLTDEIETVLNLKDKMAERIIGQPQALDAISRRIRTYRANLDDPGKPVGVFLLVGPSGIGKTETAITLSDILYGGDHNMIMINMSEYQESYTVSGLKGSPPGYVGYGKGGVLTEAVRQKPYSLVLLDEIEKAHPDVLELFYQVFDKGIMEDSEGLSIDFKNTLILLTSNVASDTMIKFCVDKEYPPNADELIEAIRPELLEHFKPAFLGRLVIVPYYPLDDNVIRQIVRLKLKKIRKRFFDNHHIELTYSEDVINEIAARCNEVDTGARNIDYILTQVVLPDLSLELLRRMAVGEICTGVYLYIDPNGAIAYRFEPPLSKTEPSSMDPPPMSVDWHDSKDKAGSTNYDIEIMGPWDKFKTQHHPARIRPNRKLASKKSKGIMDLFKR